MNLLKKIEGRTVEMERSAVATAQRRWMALLAALFPIVFLVSSFLLGRTDFQPSLSDYYRTQDLERNIFVGTLCFIASYLILYKGYTLLEDRVLELAGVSAVGVAWFPPGDGSGISVHYVFALVFFSSIFYVCIFMSKETLPKSNTDKIQFFRWCYRACSTVMIGIILFTVVTSLLPKEYKDIIFGNHIVFWVESLGIWAFSAFWYTKSRELDSSLSFLPFVKKKKPPVSHPPYPAVPNDIRGTGSTKNSPTSI